MRGRRGNRFFLVEGRMIEIMMMMTMTMAILLRLGV